MNTTTFKRQSRQIDEAPASSGVFTFFGLALVVLGALAIASSVMFTLGTMVLFGALLIAAGAAELLHAFRLRGKQLALSLLSSLLYLAVGVYLIWNPLGAALSLTVLLAAAFVVLGAVRIVRAIQLRRQRNWGWMLLSGIVNFALGAILLAGWPISGLWAIGLMVGVEMIIYGVSMIGVGSALSKLELGR